MLGKVRLPPFPWEDKFIWRWNSSVEFSIKMAYRNLLRDNKSLDSWMQVWNPHLISKMNFFGWTALHDKILTQDNLSKRGFQFPNRCVMCKLDKENVPQLFLHCAFARTLWGMVCQKFNLYWTMNEELTHLIHEWEGSNSNPMIFQLWRLISLQLGQRIWKERNNMILCDVETPAKIVFRSFLKLLLENISITIVKPPTIPPSVSCIKVALQWSLPCSIVAFDNSKHFPRMDTKWSPLSPSCFKLNVDGTTRHSLGLATSRGILRSHLGDLVATYNGILNGCTSNQAEGMAQLGVFESPSLLAFMLLILKGISNSSSILLKSGIESTS